MSSSHNIPRRRPASPSIDTLSESMKAISLRKGSTFQVSPKQETDILDPFLRGLSIPSLPSRSATCPKALEDLLIGAGERRAVELLKRVDDAIAKNTELSNILSEPEVLPLPRFMVESAPLPESKPTMRTRSTSNQQDKDSGIGSSIISTGEKMRHASANNNTSMTAVNRSIAGSDDNDSHCLSEFAQKQINHHIVEPILRQESLKEFHTLIRDVPKRIGNKDIRTLRDLEKTLIFLAPIRRYASILAATREKQARGEALDEMDPQPTDEVELQGGMTHNGKPGFLVRRRGSKYISMADDQPMTEDDVAAASAKRPMEDFSDDDAVRRSMARRKKNEPIKTYYCKHDSCNKSFKRPCDLTKHIKTHERPWKCPEESCKYYEVGWPTEKERERHVNDKHSDAPTMYKCLEAGCPYTSKRESNCKQHMEKAHNIPYVRSKNNGKGKVVVQRIPKVSPSMRSDSAVGTPFTPPAPSPSVHSSISGDSVIAGPSTSTIPASTFDFADFSSHFNVDHLGALSSASITPSWTNDRRTSVGTSATNYSPFEMPYEDMMKTEPFDFTMYDGPQQPSPESMNNVSLFPDTTIQQNYSNPAAADYNDFSPHVSSGADNIAFGTHFNDAMAMDQSYGDDFSLYHETLSQAQENNTNAMFGGLDNMGGQFNPVTDSQTDLLTLFPELRANQ
ncbi:Asparagine-rich zinc finger protein AZF1 [Sphaceloma murrayae]|uniref:Asparagine-rich zinc finger protein AZF1 n=1 Tax=Sphaceloma murrayae TaxID=2082308 RepID=A0A2K1QLV6_9PEZI|nr:Asparagine-rich zinc finger protein AZF1 [Sphaceloma murrayae]